MKLSILCSILLLVFLAFTALTYRLSAQADPSVALAEQPVSVAVNQ